MTHINQITFAYANLPKMKICTCDYKTNMTVCKYDTNDPNVKETIVQPGLEVLMTLVEGRLGRGIVGNYKYDSVCKHVQLCYVTASLRSPHGAGAAYTEQRHLPIGHRAQYIIELKHYSYIPKLHYKHYRKFQCIIMQNFIIQIN